MAQTRIEGVGVLGTVQVCAPQGVADVPRAALMGPHTGPVLDLQEQVKADRRRTKKLEMEHKMRYHQESKKLTQLLSEKLAKSKQLADMRQKM